MIKQDKKKVYNLVNGNCMDSVQTMLKMDVDYEGKLKDFDYPWILDKVKMKVAGLYTKVNLRVSLHAALYNYMLMKQELNEANDTCLTRFKLMVETIKFFVEDTCLYS